MRTYTLFIAALVSLVTLASSFAQDGKLPAPPDVVGVPFYLDRSAGELKKLPMEEWKTHNVARGLLPMTSTIQVEGGASNFRIPGQAKIVFVYDATTIPKLYKFTVKGKKREFAFETGNANNIKPITGLVISELRYSSTAFQFSADQPLDAGEYAILFADNLYTFGVDGKK